MVEEPILPVDESFSSIRVFSNSFQRRESFSPERTRDAITDTTLLSCVSISLRSAINVHIAEVLPARLVRICVIVNQSTDRGASKSSTVSEEPDTTRALGKELA